MNTAGWDKLKEQILIVLADYRDMDIAFRPIVDNTEGTRIDVARRIINNAKIIDDTPKKLQHLLETLRAHQKAAAESAGSAAVAMAHAGGFAMAASLVEELIKSEG